MLKRVAIGVFVAGVSVPVVWETAARLCGSKCRPSACLSSSKSQPIPEDQLAEVGPTYRNQCPTKAANRAVLVSYFVVVGAAGGYWLYQTVKKQ